MAKSKKHDHIFSRFDALTEAMEAHMKKIRDEGKVIVKTVIDELFKKHESLLGVQWTQFTQYFNDGDECHFYVHEVRVQIAKSKADKWTCGKCKAEMATSVKFCSEDGTRQDIPDDDEWHESYDLSDIASKDLANDIETLNSKIQEIDESMKYAFGDHKQITVTRDGGIDIESYTDHD